MRHRPSSQPQSRHWAISTPPRFAHLLLLRLARSRALSDVMTLRFSELLTIVEASKLELQRLGTQRAQPGRASTYASKWKCALGRLKKRAPSREDTLAQATNLPPGHPLPLAPRRSNLAEIARRATQHQRHEHQQQAIEV